jgi:hypothetical protein
MSRGAILLTAAVLRRSESYFFDQLLAITEVGYVCEALLGIPIFFFFLRRNINKYSSYAFGGGLIGMAPPLVALVGSCMGSTSCGDAVIGSLNLFALGALLGALSAIVFRVILGRHVWRIAQPT